MATRVSHPKVPLSTTPNMAVHSAGSGTEVPGLVPSNPVLVPPSLLIAPDPGAVAGAKTFREGLLALVAIFARFLRNPPPDYTRHGKVSSRRIAVIPLLVDLLREDPSLASIHPEDIAALAAWADALDLVATQLSTLLTQVEDTVRLLRSQSWNEASAVYVTASHRAKTVPAMAGRIATIRAMLSRGKQIDATAATAATAGHVATKAATRASNAQQRAQAASQSHARAVAAHAANTRVHGASIPATVPQGPSASVEAQGMNPAPNPQGPAPRP